MIIAADTSSGVSLCRPFWKKKVRGRARSGASALRTAWTTERAMMPMRSALMPPEADDDDPQIVMDKMMTKRAPDPMAKRIWPPWSVEKPKLNEPDSTSNSPRRRTAPVVVKYEPARAKAMRAARRVTQTNIVRISMSLKKLRNTPFQISP